MKHAGWLFVMMCIGCGDNNNPETVDAGPLPPDAFAEAMPGSFPQLVPLGGTVLTLPKVQAIFFSGDSAMQTQIDTFFSQLAGSPYWLQTTEEYGVGNLTVMPTIVSTDTPPTTETGLESWLATHLDGAHAGWPASDPSTIYSVFLPAGVVLTGSTGNSCSSYGAYHSEIRGTQGESILYALMPRCGGGLPTLTVSTSHELIEAATDPRVQTNPAYGDADDEHYVWAIVPGAETGDFCEYLDTSSQKLVGDFYVQRTWSNRSIREGHDPCVPAPETPFLGAAPVLTDDETMLNWYGDQITTKGVKVALGMTKTIDVQLYSDAPTDGDFTVTAYDLNDFFGSPPELTFLWDKQHGHNGDKLHLQITRKTAGQFLGSEFAVVTADSTGTNVSMWWGFVSN